MTIYNLGSINIDHVYKLPHLPLAGETLASVGYDIGLGGKGANQSIAAARAGGEVRHLGAMSSGDDWVIDLLTSSGVDCTGIQRLSDQPTGHAIILVDDSAENSIVLHGGANRALDPSQLAAALAPIGAGDVLLMQNETSLQVAAATQAHASGAKVIYSAAPFEVEAVRAILPYVSILALNTLEAEELFATLGDDLPVEGLLITHGSKGAEYRDLRTGSSHRQDAFTVRAVDTTGAGDCFAGWFTAGLARGEDVPTALRFASAAAALQVTRRGAGKAMPVRSEVIQFLEAEQRTPG